jgi:hypothetical protein
MRKNFFRFFAVALVAVTIVGCQPEDDDEPIPGVSPRQKYLGTWHVTSNHTINTNQQFWDMDVAPGATENAIIINGFDVGDADGVSGTVSGNSFSISAVVNGSTYQGSGSYNNNGTLTFNYTADDGAAVDTVSATASR